MGRPFDKGLVIAFGLLVALLLANTVLSFRNTQQLHDDASRVAHTQETLDTLEALLSTLKDAETGQRGFLITGEKRYLKPYADALAILDGKVERVRQLTRDNASLQASLPRLRELIQIKLDELAHSVRVRQERGFDAAREIVLSDRGMAAMEELRALVGRMQEEERELLRQRQRANNRAYLVAVTAGLLSDLLNLAAVGAFVWLLRRHLVTRARAAAALHEQRELLRSTLASIGDGVIATDARARITFLNTVAQTLTGWTQEEAHGQPLEVVFSIRNEESRQTVENPALRALREGRVVGLANHTILIARDGTEWPIDDSAAPIRARDGAVSGVVLVFREIRERKRQEAELRRQEAALREADRTKDAFLATLSHELRNPLAPIRNALQIMQLADNNQAAVRQARDMMQRQLHHLVRIIDDLMDVSRINRNKLELRKERIELTAAVQAALETSRPLIEASGHELTVTLPAEPVYLDADLTRLAQVFANLLHNAAKYTERGGRISLTAQRQGGEVMVTVRDSGIGIPADMLGSIFEMFVQVDRSLERAQGGLGIGLTLVRRLVEMHGGSVAAHSDGPERGSAIVVRLPVAVRLAAESRPPVAKVNAKAGPARCRILVVDDNQDAANSLDLMLRMLGYEVCAVYDGLEAVATAAAFRPNVVLLDVGLPGLNGYEVARQIRAQPGGKDVVLVATTGWGQDEDRRRSWEAGFNRHIVKPLDPSALEKLLADLCSA